MLREGNEEVDETTAAVETTRCKCKDDSLNNRPILRPVPMILLVC